MQNWAGIRGVKRLKTGKGRVSREGNLKGGEREESSVCWRLISAPQSTFQLTSG